MKKVNNFKIHFNNILTDKYKLSKDSINGYWKNKEKEEEFESVRSGIFIMEIGGLICSMGLGCISTNLGDKLTLPLALGAVSIISGMYTLIKKNPYTKEENKEIDADYEAEKVKYKMLKR